MKLFLLLAHGWAPMVVLLTLLPFAAEVPEGFEDEWGFHFGSDASGLLPE